MNVLLSIKPKYVDAIINGNKRYEFRRVIFRKREVTKVYIYSSSPVKKIIGSFHTGEIIEDSPDKIWKKVNEESGLSADEFFRYFNGCENAFAIEIKNFKLFQEPIDPLCNNDFTAPQSFCYLASDIESEMSIAPCIS